MTRILFLAWLLVPQPAVAARCPFGISAGTAQHVFDRMRTVRVGDGYRFDGVATNETGMSVQWSRNGTPCPAINVVLENCTPLTGVPVLQVAVPREMARSCPGLAPIVNELAGVLAAELPVTSQSRQVTALPPFVFAVTSAFGIMWVMFAVLLLDGDRLRSESRALRLSLVALFCFSLLLNSALSSGGPGDLKLNLSAVWTPDLELRWGPAPISLFRVLGFVVGDLRDTHIIWCNLVLSSTLPLLLYAIVADLGVSKIAALLAAVVAAAHPFLIAFSGVLERQATCRFAMFGCIVALLGFLKDGGARRLVAFVLGAVLATTCRPEGAQILIPAMVAALIVPAARRLRVTAVVAVVTLIALSFAYFQLLSSNFSGGSFVAGFDPLRWTVLLDGDFTPLAWVVAWSVGLVVGVRQRAAAVALISLLAIDMAWRWTGVYRMFVGFPRQVASTRYESILLIPFVIGIALLVQAVLKSRRWVAVSALGAFIVCTVLTFRRPRETFLRPFTIDYEYHFLKKHALTLPPESRLYVLDAPIDDIGLIDAALVGRFVGSRVDFAPWSQRRCDTAMHDSLPTYLYIGSSCSPLIDRSERPLPSTYPDWMRACAAIRERANADPVETIDVPAHRMSWHDFKDDTVRLGLYRLKDSSICP